MRATCRFACAVLALLVGIPDRAEAGGAAAADALVRARFFEGLPYAAARDVDAAGAAHLLALLGDPRERRIWPQVALVLGIAAPAGAFDAMAAAGERGSSGEVGRADYELAMALPLAMGHLARTDVRAYAWLRSRAMDRGEDPGWSHRAHAGQALADELRRAAVTGLAISGRAEAQDDLIALGSEAQRRSTAIDPELATSVAQARSLHARVANEGPDAVFTAE